MDHVQQTPTSGDLRQYMLPEIFLKAVLHQFSGILDIENDQLSKLIYFKNGNVVFIESNDREETFGHFLMRQKRIDPKSLQEALQELADQKELRLGEVLLKRGLIDPNSLMELLNLHQEEKLLNAFSVKKGTYNMSTNMQWPSYVNVFPFRTLNVFFSAVEKHISMDEIGQYTGLFPHALVQIKYQPNRDIPLPPFATRLLNSLNRTLISVEQLAEKMSIPSDKVIKFLFIFKLAQWIDVERVIKKDPEQIKQAQENLPPESKVESQDAANQEIVEKKEVNPILIQRMEIEYKTLEAMNFYQIFNIGLEFTLQQIQVKFFQVVSEYKKYEDLPKGKEMVSWVKTAYEVLRDSKLRAIYDRRFAFRKKDPNVERAERSFYRALRMIEQNDLEGASKILDEINKSVTDSTFRGYKAWVLFRQNPNGNMSDVKTLIEEAFGIYPADPFVHYIAGQVQLHKKNFKKADDHFRSALQVFPTYAEALAATNSLKQEITKEKRLEEAAKKEKAKEKPGFFDLSVGGIKIGGGKE